MTTVEVTDRALSAAPQVAAHRGTDLSKMVDEGVRRFVRGADLHRLIEEFRTSAHGFDDLPELEVVSPGDLLREMLGTR